MTNRLTDQQPDRLTDSLADRLTGNTVNRQNERQTHSQRDCNIDTKTDAKQQKSGEVTEQQGVVEACWESANQRPSYACTVQP